MSNLPPRQCVECQQDFTAKKSISAEVWARRLYCSYACSLAFRKRERYGREHPQEVKDAIEKAINKPSPEALGWNKRVVPKECKT